jgi:copper transport protein
VTTQTPWRLVAAALVFLVTFLLGSSTAYGHNSLEGSSPSDGSEWDSLPAVWSLTFTQDVPLDSASGEVIGADAVRRALPPPVHGLTSRTIEFALPTDLTGTVTGRWRLVGDDGHVVSGRTTFTVLTSPIARSDPSTTAFHAIIIDEPPNSSLSESNLPEPPRWLLRFANLGAVLLLGGMFFIEVAVAQGTVFTHRARRFWQTCAVILVVAPVAQGLVLVADIRGISVLEATGRVGDLFDSTTGTVIAARVALGAGLAVAAWTAVRSGRSRIKDLLIGGAFLGYLVMLAANGHSRTQGWAIIGMTADVLHTAAAAVWLGGLAAMTSLVIPTATTAQAVQSLRAFSRFAPYAVGIIVATGLIQSLRLHDLNPLEAVSTPHGRVLLAKISLVGVMLKIGDMNRRRLLTRLPADDARTIHRMSMVWRASVTEVATGGLVIALTAVLINASLS